MTEHLTLGPEWTDRYSNDLLSGAKVVITVLAVALNSIRHELVRAHNR